MKTIRDFRFRRTLFLAVLCLTIILAIMGQAACDRISLESDLGRYWGYDPGLPQIWITIAVTLAAMGLVFLAVRFFPIRRVVLRVFAWILGIAVAVWLLAFSGAYLIRGTDPGDIYGGAGGYLAYVDKLEEERRLWNKCHWFGHGDGFFTYSWEEYVDALDHLDYMEADEEPYSTIADEWDRGAYAFQYYHSETMLNVLSYFYGRWVWLLYLLLALLSVGLAVSMLLVAGKLPGKLFYSAAMIMYAIMVIMPALNGCAWVYAGVVGPPFTGTDAYYLEFAAFLTGPAIGIMLGLVGRKKNTEGQQTDETAEFNPNEACMTGSDAAEMTGDLG